jgi:hypothetical protein
MTNIALSRTERARRRCDIDDLVTIAAALGIAPAALLPLWAARTPASHFGGTLDDIQGALLG